MSQSVVGAIGRPPGPERDNWRRAIEKTRSASERVRVAVEAKRFSQFSARTLSLALFEVAHLVCFRIILYAERRYIPESRVAAQPRTLGCNVGRNGCAEGVIQSARGSDAAICLTPSVYVFSTDCDPGCAGPRLRRGAPATLGCGV